MAPTMPSSTVDVSIKLTSGRTAKFPVPYGTTVAELCQKAAAEEKAPAEEVTLRFDGKTLKRSKTVRDYGIRVETVLKVKMIVKQTLQMNLKLPKDEVVSFSIYNTSLLSEIKNKLLQEKPDMHQNLIVFKIGQMELNLSNYAYEDCLEDGEKIDVIVKRPPGADGEEEEEMAEEDKQEVLNSFAANMTSQRKVDVVFSFDTTGSMYSLLSTVQAKLRHSVTKLLADIPNIQIGIMAHGDYCDQHIYVLRKHDLSSEVLDLVNFVTETDRSGGEGNFACYEWVLRHANNLSWREDAAKALVIIGDVVPHEKSYTTEQVDWRAELDDLITKEVKVYGVQARSYEPANSFYGYMARKSGGAHIKFQHFGLITDMFLAVCYRESGDDQLKAYVDEMKNEGRMTEEMMDVMQQLEKKPEEEEEKKEEEKKEEEKKEEGAAAEPAGAAAAEPSPQRLQEEVYIAESWWDESLDQRTRVAFNYDADNDSWSRNSIDHNSPNLDRSSTTRRKSKKMKKGCALM
ncbi:uncharacterized protein [Diadema setosum]|uniref:uncharacterized protein n=1 Tax=Diadema setosum TaxID=31175 RepID=UPI003B3A025E